MPHRSNRLARLGIALGLGAVVALTGALSWLTWNQMNAVRDSGVWIRHTYDVLNDVNGLGIAVRDAEIGQQGFLLTGDEADLAPYKQVVERLTLLQGELRRLTADNPLQQRHLDQLGPLIQTKMEATGQAISRRRDGGRGAVPPMIGAGAERDLVIKIEESLDALSVNEKVLLDHRVAEADAAERTTRALAVATGVLAFALLVGAGILLNIARRRLSGLLREQRMLADQLRAALDSISQGIGVFDAQWRLERWNECLPVLLELPADLMRVGTAMARSRLTSPRRRCTANLFSKPKISCGTAVPAIRPTSRWSMSAPGCPTAAASSCGAPPSPPEPGSC